MPANFFSKFGFQLLRAIVPFLGLVFGMTANASDLVQLSQSSNRVDMSNNQIWHWEQMSDDLPDLPLQARINRANWWLVERATPNLGYSRESHWFKFRVQNLDSLDDWFLVLEYPLVRAIDIFVLNELGVQQVFQAGDRFEYAARSIDHRDYIFPIDIRLGEEFDVVIRVKSDYAIQLPVYFAEQRYFWKQDAFKTLLHGLFFGFLLLMVLYNCFLFFATRDVSYLYYVLFTSFVGLFQLGQQGFGFQYFWPTHIWWQHRVVPASAAMAFVFAALFVQTFLNTPKWSPQSHRMLSVFAMLGLGVSVITLVFDAHLAQIINAYLGVFGAIAMLVVGALIWKKGVKAARYFVLAWLVFIVSILLFAGNKLGLLPRNVWTEYCIQLGTALELSLLSFALADRINSTRREHEHLLQEARNYQYLANQAKDRAVEIERIGKERLQKNVQTKTDQLQVALKELSNANRQLEELSTVDSLTGVRSSVFFSDTLTEEWDRAAREKSVLSLMLVSVDQFEQIGDRYGHVAAEEILKNVSGVLKKSVTRPADSVARLATADFGILLPNTNESGTKHVSQGIFDFIAREPLNLGVCSISISVSISAVVSYPSREVKASAILSEAEKQLFEVMANGGNRIAFSTEASEAAT
ncbi:MAG: diguanylate cyclase [Pseudomonadales bacterium]|nr:diguanylate cyclase [Pseudomonadales bacterium]